MSERYLIQNRIFLLMITWLVCLIAMFNISRACQDIYSLNIIPKAQAKEIHAIETVKKVDKFINENIETEEPEIEEIPEPEPNYKIFDIPSNSGFKSYMPYTAITSVSSPQYKLQYSNAYTGNYGIRQVNDRYCVAVGSYFTTEIGTYFDLVLENGTVIPCILADQKADADTDASNIVTTHNGCVSEFVVDMGYLDYNAKLHGDMSHVDESWNSPVTQIIVYDTVVK